MPLNTFSPDHQSSMSLSHNNGSLVIFNKLSLKLMLQWEKTKDGISVVVISIKNKVKIGEATLCDGQQVGFSAAVSTSTDCTVQICAVDDLKQLSFAVRAIQRPAVGNWRCISSKKQTILL